MRFAVLLTIAALAAGCLQAGTPPSSSPEVPTGPLAPILARTAGLPCEAPLDGTKTSANLLQLNLTTFEGTGGPQELDIRGNLMLAARAQGFDTIDITNPLAPRVLAHYGDAGGMLDVKFTPDNQTALVGAYQNIDLVDVRHPDNLERVGRWKFTDVPTPPSGGPNQNAHMVFPAHIAGKDWVFLAPQSTQGVWVLRMDGTPDARTLTYVTQTLPVQGGESGPHDIFVQEDPFTRAWILYTADAFDGWTVFDVSNPAQPKFIGAVPSVDGFSGTHSVQATKIGSRRIVATSTEYPVQSLKVYDATNLQAPILIGYWNRGGGAGMLDDQHNINFVDGRLYMAHYAHGLYVFDMNKLGGPGAGAVQLQPVAHYAGSEKASAAGAFEAGGFWDIVVHDGLVYASNFQGEGVGLHVIAYGCLTPGDAAQRSVG